MDLDGEISYSMRLDNTLKEEDTRPLNNTLPRKNYSWIDDSSVGNCYNCKIYFSFIRRKHHCRHCGKIFCYECCNNWKNLPEDMLSNDSVKGTWNEYFASYVPSYISPTSYKRYRICYACNELMDAISYTKRLIDVFNIINVDIRLLKKVASISRLWRNASNYCLSVFRETQYKLSNHEFNNYEIRMLQNKNNKEHIVGHSKYLVSLIKVCKTEDELVDVTRLLKCEKNIGCKTLMCTRNCNNRLMPPDSINLLGYCFKKFKNTNLIKQIALEHLVCNDKEFKCYIPYLVYNIRYDDGTMTDWLIKRCLNNYELISSLYWEINLYPKEKYNDKSYQNIVAKLKNIFSDKRYEQKFVRLLQEASFFKIIGNVADDILEKKKIYNDIQSKHYIQNPISNPIRPNTKIKEIKLDKIKIKDSFSKPMILPCVIENGDIVSILYKRENVRKDQMILNLINLMQIIVKNEEGIDLEIVDYNIVPIDDNSGLIEIVDNADTLYFIKEKLGSSIINYIMEKNGDVKIKDLRDKFIKSTAAYCVLTYLLGVGDRHLDNIMVTKDGRLFHIDYGYILGKDPIFWNPSIRITPEIVEAIGGFQSEKYIDFKNICTLIFNCMRRNINLFMTLILLIPKISDINVTEDDIQKQIIKRFMPSENELDAQMFFVKNLEYKQIGINIKDFCHYHSKEKTVSSALNRVSNAIYNLWKPKNIDMIDNDLSENMI